MRDVKQMDERLKRIKERSEELANFIAKQQQIETEENSPQMKDWKAKIEQGQLLEKELEIGKAIDLYEQIRKEGYKNSELDDRIKKLHKMWDTNDEKYRDARTFIYEVFPKLDTAGLQARLPDAVKAFEECKRVHDVIAAQKLYAAIGLHLPRLTKEAEALNPAINVDDDVPAKRLKEVIAGLDKLLSELKLYIEKQK